jgi:hypothetical protein
VTPAELKLNSGKNKLQKSFDNWCPEIYRNVFVDKFNDDFVSVAPCCQANTALELVDSFDFHTSPYLNQLRQQFSAGQTPKACNKCWEVEKNGHKSRRISAIEFHQSTEPDCNVELQSIDYSATWACNLACIMCGPIYSSTWAKQLEFDRSTLNKMGRLFQKNNNIFDKLDVTKVKKIHFNGGEPLLNNDQFDFLSKLEEQKVLKDVFISYNTNGTMMPSEKIIDLWSRTGLVKIFFSIDAIGSAFEYIRWPAKWQQTEKNILTMKQKLPGNVLFGFNCSVGAYNLLEMDKVYSWFSKHMSHNRDGDKSDFCWQLVNNFHVSGLPTNIKQTAIQRLKSTEEFGGLVSLLESTIDHNEDQRWLDKLDNLDRQRKTDWRKSLEISNFIKVAKC